MKLNKGMPYWGFDHEKVLERFNGTKFINEMTIIDKIGNWSNVPVALYYSNNTDKNPYFYLFMESGKLMIGGLSEQQLEEVRFQSGIHCLSCEDVIYSKHVRDFTHCSCGKVSIDGGREYCSVGFEDNVQYEMVEIDLLTDTIRQIEEYEI